MQVNNDLDVVRRATLGYLEIMSQNTDKE